MKMTFDDFFRIASGGRDPYPYQVRFATVDGLPELLSVPTGVGKTATAVLGWLWRRRFADKTTREATPRRLVHCLPMRTLVEQTQSECQKWLQALGDEVSDISVHLLMGGEDASDWDEHPERDSIIIGTQDMLLSRALNRGYGMSRYRWPMHFGLLNNDCLWVLDETQLMGVGLTTSVQLAGLRSKLNTYGSCHTLWMSATLDNNALQTVDHPQPDSETAGLTLNDDDLGNTRVQQLLTASKSVKKAGVALSKETEKAYEKQLAEEVQSAHQPATLTLVVINSVLRSQSLFQAIHERYKKAENPPEVHLIHSRFRPDDRQRNQSAALNEGTIPPAGRIVIATQAIEAGVDISATTLFTELAPWASMVQRFGRCNRRGICGTDQNPQAVVRWIDIDTADGKRSKFTLPYEPEPLNRAREAITSLEDVGPQSLSAVTVQEDRPVSHVLRRKDLIDLFDTTPDLSGNDLDVSRYIRDGDDTDVQVYWRDWDLKAFPNHPPIPGHKDVQLDAFPGPRREELCSVSVGRMKDFSDKIKQTSAAWVWDPLTREWNKVGKSNVRPGMTILLHSTA
ncbi:MAG: CRISPR-associated helicase Cas3', partial [Planctomycetaceae bacterium]|nr:CRISPR-associated helicase Cas3' [Planctomycetaceae bacterium]